MATPYVTTLIDRAQSLYDKFHKNKETDPPLVAQIKEFWSDTGEPFPGVQTAWSAVFVSSCVKRAGAIATEFRFSAAHAVFVHQAIANAVAGTGVFRGRRLEEYAPKVGDIIQNNRHGNTFDFDFAKSHSQYESHSAIVVKRDSDKKGEFLMTIGGNESNTIGLKRIALTKEGLVVQRKKDRFICIVEDLK